ncbi:MAG TPA: hypothetical protein DCE44_11600 [Verrucomicrobiales bacterium]|nr:hypothetical protein [Verrucomicrobiales bacterium]
MTNREKFYPALSQPDSVGLSSTLAQINSIKLIHVPPGNQGSIWKLKASRFFWRRASLAPRWQLHTRAAPGPRTALRAILTD